MEFPDSKINEYSEKHSSPESELLRKVNRQTHLKVLMPNMLSGHLQGRFLSMISHMIQPKNILEIGTYTGYSALCLAEGMSEGGKITTIDVNEELEEMVRQFIEEASLTDSVNFLIGNAMDIIPTLRDKFDLVFIDADKENYEKYFELVLPSVRQGGYIVADNVLWSGKVLDTENHKDTETIALAGFNEKINEDSRVENILLPLRDGLMLARKL